MTSSPARWPIMRKLRGGLPETGDHEFLIEHDHNLHDLVVQYSDNERLIEIMQDLHDLSALARAALDYQSPRLVRAGIA